MEITNPHKSKLFIGAHPDDIELSSAVLISRTIQNGGDVFVIYTTDGAPFHESYYPRFGIKTKEEYALLRRKESLDALTFLGVPKKNIKFMDYPDQLLAKNLDSAITKLTKHIEDSRADFIFCPAYEGGHPDHDVTRFISEQALTLCNHNSLLCEYTEYNNFNGKKSYHKFIPSNNQISRLKFSKEEMKLKVKVMKFFKSQEKYLLPFKKDIEMFRIAPQTNFQVFPHERPLYYENVNIKTTPEEIIQFFNKYIKGESK
ncbi:MAG: PIG-L family deacetylase [archaeon]|nr:PIG-L family deacetylase [archaeon]